MITKFLYQMNRVNKRIITGLIENDGEVEYDENREIPMVQESSVKLAEGERKVSNYGVQYYGVFKENNEYRYVNINDFQLKVKVNATDRVAFASSLSRDMIDSILDNTNYLNCDFDFNYIESGFKLNELDNEYDDSYKNIFRHVTDDVYVEFMEEEPKFLTVNEGKYALTFDFKAAMRVYKKELRTLLITNGYIDKLTRSRDIAMSHWNIFKDGQDYVLGGDNSFKVSFDRENNTLAITKEPVITSSTRLVDDEARSRFLSNIMYLFKRPLNGDLHLLKVNGMFVQKNGELNYTLTNNASEATMIPQFEIEVIEQALLLFLEAPKFKEVDLEDQNSTYFLYEDNSNFELTKEQKNSKSIIVPTDIALKAESVFSNFDSENGNTILISNGSYVSIKFDGANKFTLSYAKTAYNASKFNAEEANVLEKLTHKKFARRELDATFDSSKILRIKNLSKTIEEMYNEFICEKNNTNIRFGSYTDLSQIKVGSDKGAYEYLEGMYVKAVLDTKAVVSKVISKVKNILVVGSTAGLDLTGIGQAAEEANVNVNVSLLDTTKWGYYPTSYVGSNLTFDGSYRLELESLTKEFINKFDLILISKRFAGEKDAVLDLISNLEKDSYNGYIINISLNKNYTIFLKDNVNYLRLRVQP